MQPIARGGETCTDRLNELVRVDSDHLPRITRPLSYMPVFRVCGLTSKTARIIPPGATQPPAPAPPRRELREPSFQVFESESRRPRMKNASHGARHFSQSGQGSDPMDDLDCGRHAESHHGSALPGEKFRVIVRHKQ